MNAEALYRELILRHSREPVGFEKAIDATHSNEQYNPLCGDRVRVLLQIENRGILDAAFEGESCAICTASASMLCELVPGGTCDDASAAGEWLAQMLAGTEPDGRFPSLEALLGVRQYPSRIDCATLPWKSLQQALKMG